MIRDAAQYEWVLGSAAFRGKIATLSRRAERLPMGRAPKKRAGNNDSRVCPCFPGGRLRGSAFAPQGAGPTSGLTGFVASARRARDEVLGSTRQDMDGGRGLSSSRAEPSRAHGRTGHCHHRRHPRFRRSPPRRRRTAGRPQRAACAWMAGTLHGLTWRRFGIFSLVLLTIALSESPAIRTLVGDGGWAEKSVELLKVWLYVLLIFTPVLLLVVAVDNRGPSAGRRRVAALAAAVAAGQALGTLLWFGAVRILYPDGFLPHRFGTEPDLRTQLRFFIGYGLLLGSVSMTATAFWYLLRRDLEAAAALHRERAAPRGGRARAAGGAACRDAGAGRAALPVQHAGQRPAPVRDRPGVRAADAAAAVALPHRVAADAARERARRSVANSRWRSPTSTCTRSGWARASTYDVDVPSTLAHDRDAADDARHAGRKCRDPRPQSAAGGRHASASARARTRTGSRCEVADTGGDCKDTWGGGRRASPTSGRGSPPSSVRRRALQLADGSGSRRDGDAFAAPCAPGGGRTA